ncbi:hypothetical protein AB8O38_00315 [Saccharomonospora xinjiangensis]|uniref:hypothetical protein n=1 Tax=Saccharomonospora xinjiangensis TaxID=75294 RepID=UPI00350FA9B6
MEEDPRKSAQIDEIVETELARHWLAEGERLLLGCPPVRAHVGSLVGGRRRAPHVPGRQLPAVRLGPPRWPLPMADLPGEDWTDDPTLGHWAVADHDGRIAVRLADHLAVSHGEARVVVTDRRIAVVYPASCLAGAPGQEVLTTFEEMEACRLAALDAPFLGRSVPPRSVIAFRFTDGSVLYTRDVHAVMKVRRARERAEAQCASLPAPDRRITAWHCG